MDRAASVALAGRRVVEPYSVRWPDVQFDIGYVIMTDAWGAACRWTPELLSELRAGRDPVQTLQGGTEHRVSLDALCCY